MSDSVAHPRRAGSATRVSATGRRLLTTVTLAIVVTAGVVTIGLMGQSSLARASSTVSGFCFALADRGAPDSAPNAIGNKACGALDTWTQLTVGTLEIPPSAPEPAVYPLRVGASGRYLVDQNNVPFLIAGDSPQALIGKLDERDAASYMADRRKYGFNSLWINLLCDGYTGCNMDGSASDGVAPFTTVGDLSTPNEAYFSRVDARIKLAADYGFNVFLDPIETGGWLGILRANGRQKAYNYGVYLGGRYRDAPNLVWLSGNDFQSWRDTQDDDLVLAVAQGIAAADPIHLQTSELNYHVSSSLDDPKWASIIQLNSAYTYFPTYAEVLKDYNRPDTKPVFMIEANYEMEHAFRGSLTLRKQEYWSMLSGATGQFYGNRYTWPFADDWKIHLDTLGSVQMAYVTSFFSSRRWFDLVPDQQHTLVTAELGIFSDSASVNDNEYVTAAATPDGELAVAYTPSGRSLTVDMSRLAGPMQARWYDPWNGTYRGISVAPLENAGLREFRTPGRNSGGDDDWVLVLELANGTHLPS